MEGFNIISDMDRIYTLMGVCPQVADLMLEMLPLLSAVVFCTWSVHEVNAMLCVAVACLLTAEHLLQHDILWDTLTARQHMMFYGRLKNLSGAELREAVAHALKQVSTLPLVPRPHSVM